jgi:hypothetical protein
LFPFKLLLAFLLSVLPLLIVLRSIALELGLTHPKSVRARVDINQKSEPNVI